MVRFEVGQALPDFRLATVGGQSFAFHELRGRTALVYGWGGWSPSREALPRLQEFQERHRASGLTLVTVAFEVTGPGAAMTHLKPARANHVLLIDATCTLTRRWGIRRLPFLILADEEGRALRIEDAADAAALARVEETLLRRPALSGTEPPSDPPEVITRQYEVEILLQAGTNFLGRNRKEDAVASLRRALDLDPENTIIRGQIDAPA